jgi:Flp pilus assembly protein TadD
MYLSKDRSPSVIARGALLMCAVASAYAPMLANGWVWDDDTSITVNPVIQGRGGLARIWTMGQNADYWPVTGTAFWAEWHLWRMAPAGYHAVSLALQIGAALLLWRILVRLAIPGAFFGALLFAVHPVNVESVAWIAQQKNLLALVFALVSVRCYLDSTGLRSRAWWCSFLAFALAMLGKGSVAILPLLGGVLLPGAPNQSPRGDTRAPFRVRRLLDRWLPLLPFFLLAAALTVVNVVLQHRGELEPIRNASFVVRLLGAGTAVWFYLGKALYPIHLSFVYPQWPIDSMQLRWWQPLIAVIGWSILLQGACKFAVSLNSLGASPRTLQTVFAFRRAWLYYLICLIPVLGFVDVYFMKYSLVADHYQQMALIGAAVLVASTLSTLRPGWPAASAAPTLFLSVTAAILGVLTYRHCRVYRDAETLYRATLAGNPSAWMAWNNLGNLQADRGQPAEAIASFREAVRANPKNADAENNLGFELARVGDREHAVVHLTRAIKLRSAYPEAENNLALALHDLGRAREAIGHAQRAVALRPTYAEARNTLGQLLAEQGDLPAGIAQFLTAIGSQPNFAGAHLSMGNALAAQGDLVGATREHRLAVQLSPDSAEAQADLGMDLAQTGHLPEAINHFQTAIRLRPNDLQLRQYLYQAEHP